MQNVNPSEDQPPDREPHSSASYRGTIYQFPNTEGGPKEFVSLPELAEAWGFEYRWLRDFIRDRCNGVRTVKRPIRGIHRAGQLTVLIMVPVADLPLLARCLPQSSEPPHQSGGDGSGEQSPRGPDGGA